MAPITAPTTNPNAKDYYVRLGLSKSATEKEIKSAYKKQALKYHPDKNPDGVEQFKKVSEAYEILTDKEKRSTYDEFGEEGLSGGGGAGGGGGSGGFNNNNPGFRYTTAGGADNFAHFDDLFRGLFENMSGGGMSGGFNNDNEFGGIPLFNFSSKGTHPFLNMQGVSGRGPSKAIDTNAVHLIQRGTIVLIKHLKHDTSLNGVTGQVTGLDARTGRYDINVQDKDRTVGLKPHNLVIQATNVVVRGLTSKPELNGKSGRIVDYNPEKEKYTVSVTHGPSYNIIASIKNIQLPTNTRVMIHRLKGSQQYNGQWGRIESFDQEASRYSVVLKGCTTLKVKMENCVCSGLME